MKDKKYLLVVLLIIPIVMIFVSNSFSIPYTEEIKSVEIQSNDYNAPGSWHIDKSAEWTGLGKARVTFDVNSIMKTAKARYKDVIFVIDVSGSMAGDKLDRAKQDAIELTNYLLSDSHNKIALITFDTTSQIVSGFTNNKDQMVNYITNLNYKDCTNYNAGLLNVDTVMSNYVKEANKDLIVLFLTDGYPNEDTPNQVATYTVLKDKYPYMTIDGIQYEMGKDIIQEIIEISDNQFIANQDTLNNVLFDATLAPIKYENFVITDYVNDEYFYIESVNDIKVPFGEVSLDTVDGVQKITWNLGNNYATGRNVKMFVNLKLKEAFHNTKGFYPTNKREIIASKLPDEDSKTKDSELTPVLKNVYEVIYDTNTPNGCTLPSIENEDYWPYQTVTKRSDSLTCPGYIFKGWSIDSNDLVGIKFINDDKFIMPAHDVHIRGTWTKQDIVKSMDGEVKEKMTLYKVLQNDAEVGTYAKKYTGNHQDSIDNSGTSDIYYYYANNRTDAETVMKEKNNVIFANQCWQMIRTTDTGGVKLLYNGEPEDGKCMNTIGSITGRSNHIGYSSRTEQSLSGTFYYGDDYTYENGSFKLSGTISSQDVTTSNASSTIPTLSGKYTCKQTTSDTTCATLYLIEGYSSSTSAYVIPLNSSSNYSQFGKLQFNANYNSPADVGYMYNTRYTYNQKPMTSTETMLGSTSLNSSTWYADSVTWGSPKANNYNLKNPKMSATNFFNNLVGKYTFINGSQTYTSSYVYYVVAVNRKNVYYITLNDTGNHTLSDFNYTYTYGDSYTDNGDGTYTITNQDGNPPSTINRSDWYTVYFNVGENKYVCKNATNDTCNDLWFTISTSNTSMTYIKVSNNYKYAKGFEYKLDPEDNTYKYFLDDDTSVSFWNINDSTNKTSLNNAHYTCFNTTGECTTISYIYYLSAYSLTSTSLYYINITGGKSIEDAKNEMLYNNDVNTTNSTIKTGVDAWYKKYILNDFDEYIEDTIYCNDRSLRNSNTDGWNPNGGSLSYTMSFKEHDVSDLSCTNETDKFSTLNNKAQLTYKVGLETIQEMNLLDFISLRLTSYWLASPNDFNYFQARGRFVNTIYVVGNGFFGFNGVNIANGVRPVVSLIPGIEYSSGDGSMENPYVVDTSGN